MLEIKKLLNITYFNKIRQDFIKILRYIIFFGFVINILMLAMPIYSLQVLDRVLSSGSLETLLMLTLIVIFSLMSLNLLQSARSAVLVKVANWIEFKLSPKLIEKSLEISVVNKNVLTSQILRELQTLKSFISGQGLTNVIDFPWALIFLTVLFKISFFHGIITSCGALILLMLALLSEFLTKRLLDAANETNLKTLQQIDSSTRNSEAIAAMGMTKNIINNWQKNKNISNSLYIAAGRREILINGITRFFRFMIQILVTGVGGYLVLNGKLTSGGMIAGSILVGRTLAPFESLIASWKGLIRTRKSYVKLKGLLENIDETEQKLDLTKPNGNLSVENLFFSYSPQAKPILKGVNFKIEEGEILAIIGESAAGKSTLARLLTGIWNPSVGSVRLDSIELSKWDKNSRGKYIGYLPQDVELFSGTVKQNVARMQTDSVDSEAIIKACKLAGVHDLILHLPDGYNSLLGPEGMSLSGGQRQRIALARAFFGDPSLVILDEPNSNLDQLGEKALAEAILRAKEQKITCIIVTHRPTLLDIVDKILILSKGQVVGFGPKDQIINSFNLGKNIKNETN